MLKGFKKEVLELRPNFRIVEGQFCVIPFNHILCGFTCAGGGDGAYISRYAVPLYAPTINFIYLTFGGRLPHPQGFLRKEHKSASAEALEFVRRIEPYEAETYGWRDLEGFLQRAKSLEHIGHPVFRWGIATTLVMLGRDAEAKSYLEALSGMPAAAVDHTPNLRKNMSHLSAKLSEGLEQAQAVLMAWEEKTKNNLGVPRDFCCKGGNDDI